MNSTAATPDSTSPIRALIVDDAPELCLLLEPLLSREGFDVKIVGEGDGAVELARTFEPEPGRFLSKFLRV